MSCMVLTLDHINILVTAAARRRLIPAAAAQRQVAGEILHHANVDAYNARYDYLDDHTDATYEDYRYTPVRQRWHASELLRMTQCLNYQCCDDPNWKPGHPSYDLVSKLHTALEEEIAVDGPGPESHVWAYRGGSPADYRDRRTIPSW